MKYYLIQDFDPALNYEDGTVISLTPEASSALSRSQVAYKIPEDFYKEEELRREEEAYFFEQLDWLGRFEEYLRSYLSLSKTHDLNLARICFNRLKYFMDPVIIQCKILASIVRHVSQQDGSVVYVKESKPANKIWVENSHFARAATNFDRFLPLMCKKYGNVPFNFHFFAGGKPTEALQRTFSRGRNTAINGLIRRIAKRAYHLFKYDKWNPRKKGRLLRGRSFLFLHANTLALDTLMKELVRQGARVFYRSGRSFLLLNDWFERVRGQVTDGEEKRLNDIRQECERAAGSLAAKGKELISWLNGKAGIDLSAYFIDYFRYFLTEACPKLLFEIDDYKRFYDRQKIDYVVSHTSSDYATKSAILAARMAGVRTVGLQHGCDAYHDRFWEMTDLDTFDIYFSTDSLSEARFRKATDSKHIHPCRVFQYPVYLDSIQRLKRPTKLRSFRRKRTVLYIPSKTCLHYRTFNCMVYPPLWYFEFQNRLLSWFSTRWKPVNFIYKSSGRDADSVLIPKLKGKGYPNIKLEERRTIDCFTNVDAVILDRPTTAFFEATAAGLPTLCLYPDFVGGMIDPESAKYYLKTLKPFTDTDHAKKTIQAFLDHPDEYVQEMPLRYDPVIEILKNHEAPTGPHRIPRIFSDQTPVFSLKEGSDE